VATSTRPARPGDALATSLPVASFLSFFAIAAIEFSVPFVAVTRLGATSLVIGTLGICRFLPQVLLSTPATRIAERYNQRAVMLGSELLRVLAFLLAAIALAVAPRVGIAIFALANIALACGSILTAVSTQVLVTAAFTDSELPRIYSRLGMAESSADAAAPFLTGLCLAKVGLSPTFSGAAVMALCACALLVRVPQVRAPARAPSSDDAGVQAPARSTLRRGLAINFRSGPLRIITVWAVSYNLGQCIIMALLLVSLVGRTPITATYFGAIQTCAVLFAVLGAFLSERLPSWLCSGLGTSVFGCGAVASYAILGTGAYLGGMTGLVLVLAGFVLDEFCSGIVLVRIQAFRASAIAPEDRPIALAAYRAINLTAVPVGFALGGIAGIITRPPDILFVVGLLMILPGILIFSRSVRESSPAPGGGQSALP
jgi:MFS family permease